MSETSLKLELLFITRLYFLKSSDALGRGMRLAKEIFISSDKALLRDFVTPQMRASIGHLEADALLGSELFAYSKISLRGTSSDLDNIVERVKVFLGIVNVFLNCLWLVRDHSGDTELAYLKVDVDGRLHSFHSNYMGQRYSMADGGYRDIVVTGNELRRARDLHDSMSPVILSETRKVPEEPVKFMREHSRLTKCFYVLQAARTAPDLAVRLAFYSTCLEASLSTDQIELQHKIAERSAYLLGNDHAERYAIYRDIGRIYSIRSAMVHGSRIKKAEELPPLSERCDQILRTLLVKVLQDRKLSEKLSDAKSDQVSDFFIRLTLGYPVESLS